MKVEQIVKHALLNNPKVTDVLAKTDEGFPLVAINHNPEGKFPLIELHATQGNDNQHADDQVYTQYTRVDVNFHCKNNEYGLVSDEIGRTLRRLGFVRVNYYSTRNPYTNVMEYTSSYRATMTQAMIDHKLFEQQQQHEVPEWRLPDGEYFDDQTNKKYETIDGEHIDPEMFWDD